MQLDLIHLVICVIVVALAFIAFLDIDQRYFLFPAVFFLTAVLNFVNGFVRFDRTRGEEGGVLPGMLLIGTGCLLLALTIVSGYVTWRTLSL